MAIDASGVRVGSAGALAWARSDLETSWFLKREEALAKAGDACLLRKAAFPAQRASAVRVHDPGKEAA